VSQPGAGSGDPAVRLTVRVSGAVQGVGFRAWTRRQARARGLVGSATNTPDGAVEIVAEGSRADCLTLLRALTGPHGPGRVDEATESWSPARGGLTGFIER
jgi:acylphosphatase